ncbi:Transcriptional activator of proteases prtT [Colletotrichum siamense]|uniref:Transcriptional activator of proteases prtT n=1 Tax=Colletotrichum siamense TaxID=690259 RepID=UPI0018723037|nr:Transcriptional activator of proteases prtT [Colletotrichum siamense]KAF5511275.1 Transcriptional activator of proteases prtT [Colletotrichum siamense]
MDHSRLRAEFNDELAVDEAIAADTDWGAGGPPSAKIYRTSKGTYSMLLSLSCFLLVYLLLYDPLTILSGAACAQCRGRKQKCSGPGDGSSAGASASAPEDQARQPCRRCAHSGVQCSFTTATNEQGFNDVDAASRSARKVDRLQKQVNEQASRISQLEATVSNLSAAVAVVSRVNRTPDSGLDGLHVANPPGPSPQGTKRWHDRASVTATSPLSKRAKIRNDEIFASGPALFQNPSPGRRSNAHGPVDFSTPMSMLRHLRHDIHDMSVENEALDPIICGVMTMEQAQETFDTFFDHCHKWAPVLCAQTQTSAAIIRQSCPALFISVCCIGYRFTSTSTTETQRRYMALISLLDHSLSRLLLKPNLADVNLDHIRAILLYIQWMPVDNIGNSSRSIRYNAISAWSMLGLAIRYALFLGLHQDAVLPFKSDNNELPTLEDVGRLRVWINLLTCDAALTLSSGLPATLNPDPVVAVAGRFRSNDNAIHPDDTRSSATCELVSILKRAARRSGSPNARSLDADCLRQVNLELDTWETDWNPIIGDQIQHYQMPFTTLRSYRLSINSACLSPLLRPSGGQGQISIYVLQALEVSLHTAALTIFALAEQSRHRSWGHYQSIDSLPRGRYTADIEAINRIKYSVDSTWISYSFATMFLVLCYKNGIIDENLKILALCYSTVDVVTFPRRQAPSSLLFRLVSLAMQIFDVASTNLLAHLALDQKLLLSGVFAVVLGDLDTDDGIPSEMPAMTSYSDREVEALFNSMVNGMDLGWYAG